MPDRSLIRRRPLIAVVVTAIATLAVVVPAWAGTYTVTGTCSAWTQFNSDSTRIAAYPECPHLRARNVMGGFSTPENLAGAGWRFDPPPGTALRHVKLNANVTGGKSWSSHISAFGNAQQGNTEAVFLSCTISPDPCYKQLFGAELSLPDLAGPIIATVRCFDTGGCPNSGSSPRATFDIAASAVTLYDPSPPGVAISGGPLTDGGWHRAQQTVNVNASDNTGIRVARALVDGDPRYSTAAELPCDYSHPLPCSNHDGVPVAVNLSGLPDGQHTLAGQADDAAGNPGDSAPQTINVDNTPPLAPTAPRLAGGPGFRKRNTFAVSWSNPPQQFAPIAGVRYRLCPQGQTLTSDACREDVVAAAGVSRLGFQLPAPGAWTLRFWLYDAAGNASIDQGVTIDGLGLISSAGKRSHLTAGRRSGRHRLLRRPLVKLGHSVKIAGRLTAGPRKRGVSRRRLLVYERVSVQGASFRPVAQVMTDQRGRYAYRARRGPSRTVKVVFPGGQRIRGQVSDVELRVRAKLSTRVDRRAVRNGEAVTFSGRLRGGRIPPGGALIELQVRTRGKWRPFATPRTDARGKWSYPYRFATVRGAASFKFRAILRKQPTYPFTAASRSLKVRVNGL